MRTLFGDEAASDAIGAATLSGCGTFRYQLTRTWDAALRPAAFVMLNPSTADATADDPTVRRCVGFARAWGCGGIEVVNLFAFRSPNPSDLLSAADPVGPENDGYVRRAAEQCRPVVAAWGASFPPGPRVGAVLDILARVGVPLMCLGVTKGGHPRHPLYVPAVAKLVPYPGASS